MSSCSLQISPTFHFHTRPFTTTLLTAPKGRKLCQRPLALAVAKQYPTPSGNHLEDTIVIAGGGPAGLAASLALSTIGMQTLVLERSAALPTQGAALGLWTNAWKALDALGAGSRLRELHPEISTVQLCRQNGRQLKEFSLKDCDGGPHEFRGVRRGSLVQSLADQMPENSIEFNSAVQKVRASSSRDSGGAEIELADGRVLRCAAVLGCDGARSPTATALGKQPASYCGQVAIRGVAKLDNHGVTSIRQVWGNGPRAGMYPLSSSELYWFVCFDAPADAPIPPTPAAIQAEAAAVVKGWQWGFTEAVVETSPGDISRSRIVDRWDLGPVAKQARPEPELVACLAGDALHPMTPNLGQGGCAALEDAVVLAQALKKVGAPSLRGKELLVALESAFVEYEKQRTARVLPLTIRSHLMGAALQLPWPPVVFVRDLFVSTKFDASHFLDHATFDCGKL